jgi:hypothetical protein
MWQSSSGEHQTNNWLNQTVDRHLDPRTETFDFPTKLTPGLYRRPSTKQGVIVNDGPDNLPPKSPFWRLGTFASGKLPKYVFDFWLMAKT